MQRCLNALFTRFSPYTIAALLLALLLAGGLVFAPPAQAQIPHIPYLAYGQTVPGEITSPNGAEHFFTGCSDETVGVSVTANDFAPRIQLYAPDQDEAIASAAAAANERTAVFDGVELPASGIYTIKITGRTRGGARGGYSVTLEGNGPDNALPDDGSFKVSMLYGDQISGTLAANDVEVLNFRGCAGDEVSVEVDADGFDPQLRVFVPIAESALATAAAEEGSESLRLEWTLTVNALYNIYLGGINKDDSGDYRLDFELEGRTPPTPVAQETVITELTYTPTPASTPTPTPTPTAANGPQGRHGNPTPKPGSTATPKPGPTATPNFTPTPEYEMPGLGEGAFNVIDVGSAHGPANSVAYSPDGSVFVTGHEDGAVCVWSTYSRKLMQTLQGHDERVNDLAFAPDGGLLASAADDGTVRLWDENGEQVAALEMPEEHVKSVAFSPDSAALVATTGGGDVLVWDVSSEQVLLTLEGHEGPVNDALYSPDGTQIATGDGAGVLRLWDAGDGSLVDSIPANAGPGSGDPILSLAYSSDGSVMVVGGVRGVNDASVQVWSLVTGDRVGELGSHGEWGSIAALSPDDTYILSGEVADPAHDGPVPSTAYIWKSETGTLAIALVGYPTGLTAALFRPDGDEILTSDGMYVYFWPGQMIDVFAATFGDPIGVQVPTPTATATPKAARATPRPTATATAAKVETPTPTTTIPAQTPTPTPTEFVLPTELQLYCTVISDRLNLRPGPGTNFNPPITVLVTGDLLVVKGRNEDGSWLQVDLLDAAMNPTESGWVSVDFVFCLGDVNDAPVVEGD